MDIQTSGHKWQAAPSKMPAADPLSRDPDSLLSTDMGKQVRVWSTGGQVCLKGGKRTVGVWALGLLGAAHVHGGLDRCGPVTPKVWPEMDG